MEHTIEHFLKEYDHILIDEHRNKLLYMQTFFDKYKGFQEVSSKYGEHYTCCIWSNNEASEGPDTCTCYLVLRYTIEFKKLVKLYERIVNKKT